jgi:hypothetical protein
VRIVARLGVQMEFVANTFSMSMPSRAIRLMFGVRFTRDPYALIACAAWSSDMMNTMFGRSASSRLSVRWSLGAGADPVVERSRTAMNGRIADYGASRRNRQIGVYRADEDNWGDWAGIVARRA